MEKRPLFNEIKTYDEFLKYYWYRDELSNICKKIGIEHSGTKQELNHNIKEYFQGHIIKRKKLYLPQKTIVEITLNSPLLECGFSFNDHFRNFFSEQTGVKNFKFSADMAAAWRKVKQNRDKMFTIQDMLDIYYQKSNYAKYDNSSCEWNQFLKDFCADKQNDKFSNKIKTASILWNIIRDSSLPKKYSSNLIEKYQKLL